MVGMREYQRLCRCNLIQQTVKSDLIGLAPFRGLMGLWNSVRASRTT